MKHRKIKETSLSFFPLPIQRGPCLSPWERWPSIARSERANKPSCKTLSVTYGDSSPKGRAKGLSYFDIKNGAYLYRYAPFFLHQVLSQQQGAECGNIRHDKVRSCGLQLTRQGIAVGNADAGESMCLGALNVEPTVTNHRGAACRFS